MLPHIFFIESLYPDLKLCARIEKFNLDLAKEGRRFNIVLLYYASLKQIRITSG